MNRQSNFAVGMSVIALVIAVTSVSLVALRRGEVAEDRLPPMHWEATLFVPTKDNQGVTFPDDVWNKVLTQLVTPFGGATVYEPKDGYWLGAAGVAHEPVRPVVVTFEHSKLSEFRTALLEMGRILGQEAMYARLEKCRVELVEVRAVNIGNKRAALWVGPAAPHNLTP